MNISKLRNIPKSYIIIFLVVIMLGTFSLVLPSFASYQNRNALDSLLVWDGTVASSYAGGNGTENDPYLISSGSELAYFISMTKENAYEDTYFKITKDIILNEGVFQKDNIYYLNDTTYYLNGNGVYQEKDFQNKLTSLNLLEKIENFSGHINGANHTIYGYYGENLFNNITSASIENIIFSNFLITRDEASFIDNISDSLLDNIIFTEGFINGNTSSSIINSAYNLNISKVVNNISFSASKVSGFILNATGNINITSSYTKGSISGSISSPLLGSVQNAAVEVDKYYNSSEINGDSYDLAIDITSSTLIANGFNTQNLNGIINSSENSEINLNDYYSASASVDVLGSINETPKEETLPEENPEEVTPDNPENPEETSPNAEKQTVIATGNAQNSFTKDFIKALGFNEFISLEDLETSPDNIWVYNDNLPELYTEYLNSSRAKIMIKDLSWEYLEYNPKNIYFNMPIAFSIENKNEVKPLKNIYYYLSSTPLTNEEIKNITSWENYTNFVNLEEDGSYIIYVKVIDIYDEESYLNSDIIIKDETMPVSFIKGSETWNTLKTENLNYSYLTKASSYEIGASDETSDIKSIEYAILNSVNTDPESITWEKYVSPINIKDYGLYIIYAKITDNADNITYINTDYLVYSSYTINTKNNLVNNNSKVTYNFSFKDTYSAGYNGTRVLKFSENLPKGTIITLINNNSKKAYYYKVENSINEVYLNTFKSMGTLKDIYLNEGEINNSNKEDLSIIIDFSKATLESNILKLKVDLNLFDANGKLILNTDSNISSSIYLDKEVTYNLAIDNTDDIVYQTDFNVKKKLQLNLIFMDNIIDTSISNQKLGLELKLTDEKGNTVPKEKLKNWLFKLNNQIYTPSEDGVVLLKWQDKVLDATSTLEVSSMSDTFLPNGSYKLVIKAITSYDGIYKPIKETEPLYINITKENNILDSKVIINPKEDYQILYKKQNTYVLDFLTDFGKIGHQNIEVNLYQKEKLTAYDQNYILYEDENILSYTQNSYGLRLNLDTQNLAPGGYKFVFKVLDKDNNVIEIINKLFIVR